MAIAGLWESFTWPDGRIERTYCIITIEASGAVAEIHDRMPLILEEKDWPLWLGEAQGDPAALPQAARDDSLVLRPVGRTNTRRRGSASR
jgi:putative SOS response-associated peptidase YedK